MKMFRIIFPILILLIFISQGNSHFDTENPIFTSVYSEPTSSSSKFKQNDIMQHGSSKTSSYNIFNATEDALALMKDFEKALKDNFAVRTLKQRGEIINEYNRLNPNNPFYPADYKLLMGDDMMDFKFALNQTVPVVLLLEYLHSCLELKPSYWWGPFIVEIMALEDAEKRAFLDLYGQRFGKNVDHGVDKQDRDYKHFLQEVIKREREPVSTPFSNQEVTDCVKILWDEGDEWDDHRTKLDYFVLNRSEKFIQAVAILFEQTHTISLINYIDQRISDNNLKIGYKFLVMYVINHNEAIATRLYDSFNEPYTQVPTKITTIVGYSETTLKDINEAFKVKFDTTISQYFLSKSMDPINQALAAMSENAGCGTKSELNTTPPLPMVPPTTVLPAPVP